MKNINFKIFIFFTLFVLFDLFFGFSSVFSEEIKNPEQLFDINLSIDKTTIKNINELSANATFVSFGRVPTPVDLTFIIFNSDKKEVYKAKNNIVVETEFVLNKQFKDIGFELTPGKYTLVLVTLYNTVIEDEFKQKFEIISDETKAGFIGIWQFWILIAVLIVIAIAIMARKI